MVTSVLASQNSLIAPLFLHFIRQAEVPVSHMQIALLDGVLLWIRDVRVDGHHTCCYQDWSLSDEAVAVFASCCPNFEILSTQSAWLLAGIVAVVVAVVVVVVVEAV